MRPQITTPHPDSAIGELADRQHGVVAHRQLLAAGASPSMIQRRVRSGHLIPLQRGVYAVGHRRLRREGFWLAAVLAIGPGAVLSHRSAAALHGIANAGARRIDVSTPADRRGGPGPFRIHGRRALHPDDITIVEAIPTTTVARTLVDLATILSPARLEKAISEAERLGRFDLAALDAALDRLRGRHGRGRAALAEALARYRHHGETITHSELEDRFVALLDANGLPRPRLNAAVGRYEVDALYPTARLAIELDGYAFHRDHRSFQRDRTRANDLIAAGYTVLRFTYDDVSARGTETAARIAGELSRAPAAAPRLRRSARPAP